MNPTAPPAPPHPVARPLTGDTDGPPHRQTSNVHRPRIPVILALGTGILTAGLGALFRQGLPAWAAYSRPVDDQRNSIAKPEVRDGAEEQVGHEDGSGELAGPALVDPIRRRDLDCRSFLPAPAATRDEGRPRGLVCLIRGPPLHA